MHMNTLLTYTINVDPFPLMATLPGGTPVVATVTIRATNNGNTTVSIDKLAIQIPIGTQGNELTQDSPEPQKLESWDCIPTGKTGGKTGSESYEFKPGDGKPVSFIAGAHQDFIFPNVQINTNPGRVNIAMTEVSPDTAKKSTDTAVCHLFVTKFPGGWGNVDFEANPPDQTAGLPITLNWNGPVGATYTIEYYTPETGVVNLPAAGKQAFLNFGQYPGSNDPSLTLQETTQFTLNVEAFIDGQSFKAQDQKTVKIKTPTPVISQFNGSVRPTLDGTGTMELFLNWDTTYAETCTISEDPYGVNNSSTGDVYRKPISADYPLYPKYSLTATNPAGNMTSSLSMGWKLGASVSYEVENNSWPPKPGLTDIAISPDARQIYAKANGQLSILNATTLQTLFVNDSPQALGSMTISPDGTRIYSPGGTGVCTFQIQDKGLLLQLNGTGAISDDIISSLTLSMDGQLLCALNENGSSLVMLQTNTEPDKPLSLLSVLPTGTSAEIAPCMTITPDKLRIYVGLFDDTSGSSRIAVIDTKKNQVIGYSESIDGCIGNIAVSGDGSRVVANLFNGAHCPVQGFNVTTDAANPLQTDNWCEPKGYIESMTTMADGISLAIFMISSLIILDMGSLQVISGPLDTGTFMSGSNYCTAYANDGLKMFLGAGGLLTVIEPDSFHAVSEQ